MNHAIHSHPFGDVTHPRREKGIKGGRLAASRPGERSGQQSRNPGRSPAGRQASRSLRVDLLSSSQIHLLSTAGYVGHTNASSAHGQGFQSSLSEDTACLPQSARDVFWRFGSSSSLMLVPRSSLLPALVQGLSAKLGCIARLQLLTDASPIFFL